MGWFSKNNPDLTTTAKESSNKVVCVDCDAKTNQVPLPSQDKISSEGKECSVTYTLVAECMKQNKGQVTACTKEWDAFKNCHSKVSA